jgi:hypothetical protein
MINKEKILRVIKFVIWGVFILVVFYQFIFDSVFDSVNLGEMPIKYIIVVPPIFFAVYMMLAFSIHLLNNAWRSKKLDSILFEMKKPTWLYVAALVVLITVISAGYYFIFNNELLPEKFHFLNIDSTAKAVGFLVFFMCHFLLIVTVQLIWLRPSFFIVTKNGFLYEPGSISPGLILWEDIEAINEADLLYNPGGWQGSTTRTYLVITLKDHSRYFKRYNLLLRLIVILQAKITKALTGKSADIIIQPWDFGNRYNEIKTLMEEYMKKHAVL